MDNAELYRTFDSIANIEDISKSNANAVFLFFKMTGCGHCDIFYQNFQPDSPWYKLQADKELTALGVIFAMIEFGKVDENGNRLVPPPIYGQIRYAPTFRMYSPKSQDSEIYSEINKQLLQNGDRSAKIVESIEYTGPKSYEKIKEWIKETVTTNSAFSQQPSMPATQTFSREGYDGGNHTQQTCGPSGCSVEPPKVMRFRY